MAITLNKLLRRFGPAVACVGVLAACEPTVRSHGYTPAETQLSQIRVGQDTRGSVSRKIGRPGTTGIFTDDGWYYVSVRVHHRGYSAPETVERNVIAILFDERDVVASVDRYGLDDGRIVDLETNTTPTFGRQLTILEQAFQNIGIDTGEVLDQ